jgi:20S proteasome alpha/beta subunit
MLPPKLLPFHEPKLIQPKPRPLEFRPTPQRFPERKRVTIAAAFPCKEGLIIATDTEESIAGYIKTDTQKMRIVQGQNYDLVITGAGDSDLIDCFVDELVEALEEERPEEIKGIWKVFKNTHLQSFRNHVVPYAAFPKDDRPYMDLLIGLHIKVGGRVTGAHPFRTELFKANGTTVKRVNKAECIGTGIVLAQSLVDQFFDSSLNLVQTGLLAVYVLRQTKRWAQYCGGKTDIAILSNTEKELHTIPTDKLKSLERHFDEFGTYLKPVLINCADINVDPKLFKKIMAKFQADVHDLQGKFVTDILHEGLVESFLEGWGRKQKKQSVSRK